MHKSLREMAAHEKELGSEVVVPKKKNFFVVYCVYSQRVTTSGTASDNEWQRVTTIDNKWYKKWQREAKSDNEWKPMIKSRHFG